MWSNDPRVIQLPPFVNILTGGCINRRDVGRQTVKCLGAVTCTVPVLHAALHIDTRMCNWCVCRCRQTCARIVCIQVCTGLVCVNSFMGRHSQGECRHNLQKALKSAYVLVGAAV